MQAIINFFATIQNFGKYLMVPLMLLIIGLVFGAKIDKALKGAVLVGVGLMGLDLVIGLISTYLGPIQAAIVAMVQKNLTIDLGWTVLSGIAFSTQVGTVIIPFLLVVNLVWLAIGATRTLDIDIWNFWLYAFCGSYIAAYTDNIALGLLAAAALMIVMYTIGDITARKCQETSGIPGIAFPHANMVGGYLFGYALEPVYNAVEKAFKKNKGEDEEKSAEVASKLKNNPFVNMIKDPVIIGLLLGIIVAVVARLDVKQVFLTGMAMAALMYLLPRMAKVLMEGFVPISEQAKVFMNKHFKGRDFYIGMDYAVLMGHPTAIIGAVVLIPIMIVISIILPGNLILPVATLASTGYWCIAPLIVHKGKTVRSVITASVFFVFFLLAGTHMLPTLTKLAMGCGYEAGASGYIAAMSLIVFPVFLVALPFEISPIVGCIWCVLLIVVSFFADKRYFKKLDAELAAEAKGE